MAGAGDVAAQADPARGIAVRGTLAEGMHVRALTTHRHDRGSLTELWRRSWGTGHEAQQWNLVTSPAGVMRGMHIHLGYREYYVLLSGRTTIGTRDLRPGSPTENAVALIEASGESMHALIGPPGVAHGIYCHEPSVLLVGVTAEHDPANELGCHWRDPALEIDWPFDEARVSERDGSWPPLADVLPKVPPWDAS